MEQLKSSMADDKMKPPKSEPKSKVAELIRSSAVGVEATSTNQQDEAANADNNASRPNKGKWSLDLILYFHLLLCWLNVAF